MFNWLCPDCSIDHFYSGSQTTRATTNCPKTKKKFKVFQYKVVVKKEDPILKRLRPPREVETSVESNVHGSFETKEFSSSQVHTDSQTSAVDPVHWLANNHSFNMLINEMLSKFAPGFKEFGIKTRGTKQVIRSSFDNTRAELLKELKEVLRKRNES